MLDLVLAEKAYVHCFESIAPRIDAFYASQHGGLGATIFPRIVAIANQMRIPTFSQAGSDEVKKGMLLSVSRQDFTRVGVFQAAIMAKVLNGAKPRELPQVFEEEPNLAINLKTAEEIGFDVSVELLAISDEIYRETEIP